MVEKVETPIDNNSYVFEVLSDKLVQLGYQVEKHPKYLSLIVNSNIEIATTIIENPNAHPSILQLMTLTIQPQYFPNGIEENIISIGTTIQEKVNFAIDDYIDGTFLPIIESLSTKPITNFDFSTTVDNKEIHWHTNLGNIKVRGKWNYEGVHTATLFEIIKDELKTKLTSNKFNWLKLYISKQANGEITGECFFNDEPWEDGLTVLTEYAKLWKMENNFRSMKQLIVFRKCDKCDTHDK